jgi:hypothetical protein
MTLRSFTRVLAVCLLMMTMMVGDVAQAVAICGTPSTMVDSSSVTSSTQAALDSQTFYTDATVCPTTLTTDMNSATNHRSTCPWYYEANHDATRFPAVILYAVCRCLDCVGSDGTHQCQTIYKTLTVFVREDNCDVDGFYKYQQVEQQWPTGCVCVKKTMAESSTLVTPSPVNSDDAGDMPLIRRK